MNLNTTTERLYLFKGDGQSEDIYIDSPVLPQHQINALRFIYKQYKKKNPGIILNDPEGYGKTIEVVLFVKAIKHLLKEPILIICSENEVDIWRQNFKKWANLTEEVAVNPENPCIKGKKVLIVTWSEFHWFCNKNWNVMVVHHDKPNKELFKRRFDADFKIWISSDDMMKDLDSFITIYEWLNPKGDINLLGHHGTELERLIHTDAFMQDIVIRGRGFDSPEIRIKKNNTSPTQNQKNSRKTKNKDPTGAKTKRTKKKDVNISPEINSFKLETVTLDENNDSSKPRSNSKLQKDNKKPESNGPIKRIRVGQSKATYTRNVENIDCLPVTKIKNEITDVEMSTENRDVKSVRSAELSDQTQYKVNNNEGANINVKVEDLESNSSQNITLHYSERDLNCSEDDIQMDADLDSESLLTFHGDAIEITEYNQKDNGNNQNEDKNDVLVNNNKDLKHNINNETNGSVEMEGDQHTTNFNSDGTINSDMNHVISKDNAGMCPKASEIRTDNKNLLNKTFDTIMEQMEEKVMKKFKGSFLDNIF